LTAAAARHYAWKYSPEDFSIMKRAVACLTLAALCLAATALGSEHTKDSLETVRKNLAEKKAVLLDVREQKEWDRGHLKQAQLVPLSELTKSTGDPAARQKLEKALPKDRIVYCHCARGVRALMAGDILKNLGYDVRPLAAGFEELGKAGFEVEKK
jgi:rhodanese-related sulfurtransferase